MSDYDEYVKKLRKYRFNSEKMCSDYESLFLKMFNNKEDILQSRSLDLKKSIIEKMYYQYKIKKMKNV